MIYTYFTMLISDKKSEIIDWPFSACCCILFVALHVLLLPLACQINCGLLYYLSASIFKVLQCRSKLVKILSECQTIWIQVRRQVTPRSKLFAYGTMVVLGGLRVKHWTLFIVTFYEFVNPKPTKKLNSPKFLVCFNCQSDSMSQKVCKNVWLSNSLDLNETPNFLGPIQSQTVCIRHLDWLWLAS